MGQVCRLFKWCGNLPPGHCGVVVQVVQAVLEPTSGALWGRCAGCLSGVETYLQGTVGQCAGCSSGVRNYFPGTLGQGCKLFKMCQNLSSGHWLAWLQAV